MPAEHRTRFWPVFGALMIATMPCLAGAQGTQQQQRPKPIVWASPSKYLAGTTESRSRSARTLGIDHGRWVVIYLTLDCSDCERAARMLDKYADIEHIIGVAVAPREDIARWVASLQLHYPVKPIDERCMEDLGATLFPTIVLFEDSRARGARAPSMEKGWR